MSELNELYREKNGFVFLVCASGKPADAILSLLKARLPNDRHTEVCVLVARGCILVKLVFDRLA